MFSFCLYLYFLTFKLFYILFQVLIIFLARENVRAIQERDKTHKTFYKARCGGTNHSCHIWVVEAGGLRVKVKGMMKVRDRVPSGILGDLLS